MKSNVISLAAAREKPLTPEQKIERSLNKIDSLLDSLKTTEEKNRLNKEREERDRQEHNRQVTQSYRLTKKPRV